MGVLRFENSDTSTLDYTSGATGTAIFELTVTDSKGKSSTDSVNHSNLDQEIWIILDRLGKSTNNSKN